MKLFSWLFPSACGEGIEMTVRGVRTEAWCDLVRGHRGPHLVSLRWEVVTDPEDVGLDILTLREESTGD